MKQKDRLVELFKKIPNDSLRVIIADVIDIERKHRISSRENFPRQKIKDIIDKEARLFELKAKSEG
ncbi:MAG TPA: hypothetical protein PLT92_14460 [Ignavibacteriaceae bacterium]|nr:hypothetical protein [Ignavibacteriaceae bacterium]